MQFSDKTRRRTRAALTAAMLTAAGAFLGAPAVSAQTETGMTVVDSCMDDLFPGDLSCTANDVRIGSATNIVITDPCEYPGDSVTFDATFEVQTGAQERYDIGLYFAVDGDLNGDGALTGTCSVSTLPEPASSDSQFVDLDATCKGGSCPQPSAGPEQDGDIGQPDISTDVGSDVTPKKAAEGCNCQVDGATSYSNLIWLLAAFGILLLGWRRRA